MRTVLPPLASDTAGACSMLYETGGLTVIHDAAGSMEVFITFEEQRSLEHCRTVVSQLNQIEAATGNERILLDKITRELELHPAPFAAIVGTPVPFTISIDLEGIAAEAETLSGTPVFAVPAGGFELYHKGAGAALKSLLQRLTLPPQGHTGFRVNLLGAFPMDYSSGELEGLRSSLLSGGVDEVTTLTLNGSMEEILHAADADRNLVIGLAGLPAAKWLQKKYKIPYSLGVPFDERTARQLLHPDTEPTAAPANGKKLLVLGDAVFAATLAGIARRRFGFDAVAGFANGTDAELKGALPTVRPDTETLLREELSKAYDVIIGDPLYRLLVPQDSRAVFLPRPHQAMSSRLYPPVEQTLDTLVQTLAQYA